ncbi:hypothetical protein BKA82DRAFT_29552 [Pisolithus tinctorius]|nr:hypothetical protein BKA82DRAFT_29552 [Pisolithus tinctorius]
MSSNPNDSPPNVGVPADDLACTASVLQLLLGSSQGDTESRNALLAHLGSLMGPSLAPTAPEPQAASSPALPVDAPPADVPTPATTVVQELDPSPTLDLPTFDTLPDALSSTSTSTSTIAPSRTPSPSLPTLPPADPTMPTRQTLDVSESGLECLPANSPLTGHVSLDRPSSTVPIGTSSSSNDGGFPIYPPSPAIVVASLEPSALEPWGSNARDSVLLTSLQNDSAQSRAWVQALCTGSTPPLSPLLPVVEITQRPARASKRTRVKSPSPSPTPPPSTSGASSSNSAPTPSTSSSPPSLPSLSNTEMLVVLREALRTATDVLDQASKGHVASEKALGKRKSRD